MCLFNAAWKCVVNRHLRQLKLDFSNFLTSDLQLLLWTFMISGKLVVNEHLSHLETALMIAGDEAVGFSLVSCKHLLSCLRNPAAVLPIKLQFPQGKFVSFFNGAASLIVLGVLRSNFGRFFKGDLGDNSMSLGVTDRFGISSSSSSLTGGSSKLDRLTDSFRASKKYKN